MTITPRSNEKQNSTCRFSNNEERLAFSSIALPFAPGKSFIFSCGIATLKSDQSADDWIAQADEALYQAKRLGKNRIIVHT